MGHNAMDRPVSPAKIKMVYMFCIYNTYWYTLVCTIITILYMCVEENTINVFKNIYICYRKKNFYSYTLLQTFQPHSYHIWVCISLLINKSFRLNWCIADYFRLTEQVLYILIYLKKTTFSIHIFRVLLDMLMCFVIFVRGENIWRQFHRKLN